MEFAEVAELQQVLEGVALPAEKKALVQYGAAQGATPAQLGLLARLRDRTFGTIDDVAESLLAVQPEHDDVVPREPREESSRPPGGDDYTNAAPVSGAVRN